MKPRNLRRTRAFALVPIAALTASVVALEARDGVVPTTIRSDAAATTPTSTASAGTAPSAPTTVSSAPVTAAPGAVQAPASATRGGAAALGAGLPPLRARTGTTGLATGATVNTAATSAISPIALAAYQRAASVIDQADTSCRLDWQLLAGIGQVESGNGTSGGSQLSTAGVATPGIFGPSLDGSKHTARILDTDNGTIDGDSRFDRAVGPMQILPATWVQIAVDGDGDGRRDPQDINDAALASAVYLCSTGTDLSDAAARRAALLRYNHSTSYAAEVLALATAYTTDDVSTAVPGTFLLPPGAGPTTVNDAASTGTAGKPKHHKHTKQHGKHAPAGIKQEGGSTQGSQPPAKPIQPSGPTTTLTRPTQPAAATKAQLDDLCRTAITKTYPDATEDAIDKATAQCITDLDGNPLAQARTKLDDLVTDPDLATDFPDLGQPVTPSDPSDAPSDGPTGTPSDAPSGDPSSTPGDGPSDAPAASSDASAGSSQDAPATSSAG